MLQKKEDKDKIYSLHEPEVYCKSKGKAHKKYEFGSKVSVDLTKESGIAVGGYNFEKNIYDGHILDQVKRLTGKKRRTAIESVIGDLKEDHRLRRNYLKGTFGDMANVLLSLSSYNLAKRMRLEI